jgi:hypothetical protein
LPLVRPLETLAGNAHRNLPLPTSVSAQPAPAPSKAPGPAKRMVSSAPTKPASASNVIQRAPDLCDSGGDAGDSAPAAVDVDEIVEEVQRQFMRQLAIEGERRGAMPWQ